MASKIVILFYLLSSMVICAQNFTIGRYMGKDGSILEFHDTELFDYKKIDTLFSAIIVEEMSSGKFKINKNLISLTSDFKMFNKQIQRKYIKLNQLESLNNDSISISISNDDFFKVLLCNANIFINEDFFDSESCFLIENKDKIPQFYNEFYLKIYPNLDSPHVRDFSVNNLYFITDILEKYDKNVWKIEIDKKLLNEYSFLEFKNSIAILNEDKIFFRNIIYDLVPSH